MVVCTELVETTAVEVELVALANAAAGVSAFWRAEVGREDGPVIYCYRLDLGVYVEAVTLQAGVAGTVDVPGGGTVTFDPADLVGSRRPRS